MQQSIKREIAKEIIIFFSSLIIIALVWTGFWGTNEIRKNKVSNLRNDILTTTKQIDSIKSIFPKVKSLREIIIGEIPSDEKYYFLPDPSDPLEILKTDAEKAKLTNISQLYAVLLKFNFQFVKEKGKMILRPGELHVPPFIYFYIFKDSIEKETMGDSLNLDNISSKPLIGRVYNFLIENKLTNSSIQELVATLNAIPLSPPHSVVIAYQVSAAKKNELSKSLETINSKIYSKQALVGIAKWLSIIVLIIVYPLRLLFRLLLWAINTLR